MKALAATAIFPVNQINESISILFHSLIVLAPGRWKRALMCMKDKEMLFLIHFEWAPLFPRSKAFQLNKEEQIVSFFVSIKISLSKKIK